MAKQKISQKADKIVNIEYAHKVYTEKPKLCIPSRKTLAIGLSLILLIVTVATPIVINKERIRNDKETKALITRIFNSSKIDGDFLSSALQYHDLASAAKDRETYLLIKSMEAFMYSIYIKAAINDSDSKSNIDTVINNTLLAVDAIKKDADSTSLFYYFAYAVESNCYDVLNLPTDDKKWVEAISKLEGFTENNFPNLRDDFSPLVFEAAYRTLGEYFRRVAFLKFSPETHDEAAAKMTKYKQLYATFFCNLMEDSGTRPGVLGDVALKEFYEAKLNQIFFPLFHSHAFSPSTLEELNNIIVYSRTKLKEIDYNPRTETVYIAFNRLIAKALACKYMIYQESEDIEKMEHCAQECHDIVASVLRLPKTTDEDSIHQIFFMCWYMFIVNEFTEEDVIYFYENTLKFLSIEEYNNSSLEEKEVNRYLICSYCKIILDKYGYNEKIYELGLTSAKELYAYSNILRRNGDKKDKSPVPYYSYFTEYKKP